MPDQPDPSRTPHPASIPQAGDTPHPTASQGATFETSLAELNEAVNRLESGTLGLSESIAAYERGVVILRRLHEQLADVEERVRMLVRIDDQGRPILADVTPESVGQQQPAAEHGPPATSGGSGSRRGPRAVSRSGRPRRLPGMDDGGESL